MGRRGPRCPSLHHRAEPGRVAPSLAVSSGIRTTPATNATPSDRPRQSRFCQNTNSSDFLRPVPGKTTPVERGVARHQVIMPTEQEATVFTMTIRSAVRTVITSARSHRGEAWEDTLRRLYHETLPPHEPRRRVVFMASHGF